MNTPKTPAAETILMAEPLAGEMGLLPRYIDEFTTQLRALLAHKSPFKDDVTRRLYPNAYDKEKANAALRNLLLEVKILITSVDIWSTDRERDKKDKENLNKIRRIADKVTKRRSSLIRHGKERDELIEDIQMLRTLAALDKERPVVELVLALDEETGPKEEAEPAPHVVMARS